MVGSVRGAKFVYDELHGFIPLKGIELELVDTPTFQRLRRVKQLAQAWYVYPGAVHTRFSHSLGVFRITSVLTSKFVKDGLLSEEDADLVKVAALLHDIGHTPYSHALEQYLLVKYGLRHEDITTWIIEEDPYIKDVLIKYGIEPSEISAIIRGIHKNQTLNMILSSDLDVDRLDYLPRDALHTGVAYGLIDLDRILQTITLDKSGYLSVPIKSIHAIESFYMARLHMYRAVYYHKTITSYQLLLSTIYRLMIDDPNIRTYLEPYVDPKGIMNSVKEGRFHLWDDFFVGGLINLVMNKDLGSKELKDLISIYLRRRSYKVIYERIVFSDEPIRSGLKELVAKVNEVLEREGLSDYSVRTFLEVVNITSEKDSVRIIDVSGESKPIRLFESSIVRNLPKYMNIFRVYALPPVEAKARSLLGKVLSHEVST